MYGQAVPNMYQAGQNPVNNMNMYISRRNPFGHQPSIVQQQVHIEGDIKKLNKAMKGFGTNEDDLIDVLCKRTAHQRMEISREYKETYNKDLLTHVKDETGGNLERIFTLLLQKPESYDADELKEATKGIGTDESTLIEILVTRTNDELAKIKKVYKNRYEKELEEDIKSDTSGDTQKLLLALARGQRDESFQSNKSAAEYKAKELKKAGVSKWGTDEGAFIKTLTETSFVQLAEVFDIYEDMTNEDIDKSIKSEMGGDLKRCLLTITACVRNLPGYFADKLKNAASGIGTDDRALTRIIITRAEKDLKSIADAYQKKFEKSLEDMIESETGGDYKKSLQAIVRGNFNR